MSNDSVDVKKKGFPSPGDAVQTRIAYVILEAGKSITVQEIADLVGEPRQKIAYHIPTMVREGLLVPEGKKYRLQNFIMKEDLFQELVEGVADKISIVWSGMDNPTAEKAVNNFGMFLNLVSIHLQD